MSEPKCEALEYYEQWKEFRPDFDKIMAAFIEKVGGPEKAREIIELAIGKELVGGPGTRAPDCGYGPYCRGMCHVFGPVLLCTPCVA